jgi:hypothetical protein
MNYEGADDGVSLAEALNTRPGFFNNTRYLMAEDGWEGKRQFPFDDVQVGMAYAAGRNLDEDLAHLRLGPFEFLDGERFPDLL